MMNKEDISSLLNSFFISSEELRQRKTFSEFSSSISNTIIDKFAKDYLLENPYLSVYIAHLDTKLLLKKFKTFFNFLLISDVDEKYINEIHKIGFVHYDIKLEPAKLSYGFWAINEILMQLTLENKLTSENRLVISKFLKFVEHTMNDGYYIAKEKNTKAKLEVPKININNELHLGFNHHMLNLKKIELLLQERSNLDVVADINNNANECSFGKVLHELDKDEYKNLLAVEAKEIQTIHNQWHDEFKKLKKSLKERNEQDTQKHYINIKTLTSDLSSVLNSILNHTLDDGYVALTSGVKAMRKATELFYSKDYKNIQEHNINDLIYEILEKILLSEFSWTITDVQITNTPAKEKNNLISKTIRYNSENIFINITVDEKNINNYINEIITLILEVIGLHLFVQEKELSLIEFANKTKDANKSKDIFLANMSHELRTPINAITGFSQILMMRKDTPDKVKGYVEKINIAGNNLLDLVNTILDFAKLESGKMQFNPSLNNISDILKEVNILISPLASKKNIHLKMPKIISLNLYVDKILFKQVLINLLTNAIKFTKEDGEVSLNIVYNEKKRCYSFEVKDNGIGLDEEGISKLFQAFSQVEGTYQKEQQGTGLGLMISKNIIEDLHKGKIWVESVKGQGSSFFIDMPTPTAESNTYSVNKAPKDAKNILIVEDSAEFQNILISHLEHTHNITITDTVNKAKELIGKYKYDFIILDFFLMDGISSEILQFMEKENISIPSIVISAEDEIHISSSLAGSSNLECIINKKDIDKICNSIKGKKYNG